MVFISAVYFSQFEKLQQRLSVPQRRKQEEVLTHSLSYSILHGFFETNLFAQLKEDTDYLEIIRRLKQYARLPAFSVS